jgi:hypothetical protein
MTIRCLLAVALFMGASATVLAEVVAEGSLQYEGGDWKVADAIAYARGDEISVSLSNIPFDREAFMADGKIDQFDLLRHEGNRLTITIDENPGFCLHTMTRTDESSSSMSSCKKEFLDATTIDIHDGTRIAGSVKWGEADGEHIHVRFDVPAPPKQD